MKKITSLRGVKRRSNPELWIAALPLPSCLHAWHPNNVARNDRKKERGSVFVYILIAVALIAALSYAVSRGNRNSTSTMTDQQAKLAAQEIIDYGNTVAAAVQKLRLRGCTDTQISFEGISTASFTSDYINPNAPSDKSCHIFDLNGGSLSSNSLSYQLYDSGIEIDGIGNNNSDNESTELIFLTRLYTISTPNLGYSKSEAENICQQINLTLHGNSNIPLEGDITRIPFKGTYTYTTSATEFTGKNSACVMEAADTYSYYQVLIAR